MNNYALVIDILNKDLDYAELVRDIAKHNPAAVIHAYSRLYLAPTIEATARRDKDLLSIAKTNKIGAVKQFRELTGATLADALSHVNALLASAE